jgi:hypothetical protein
MPLEHSVNKYYIQLQEVNAAGAVSMLAPSVRLL